MILIGSGCHMCWLDAPLKTMCGPYFSALLPYGIKYKRTKDSESDAVGFIELGHVAAFWLVTTMFTFAISLHVSVSLWSCPHVCYGIIFGSANFMYGDTEVGTCSGGSQSPASRVPPTRLYFLCPRVPFHNILKKSLAQKEYKKKITMFWILKKII